MKPNIQLAIPLPLRDANRAFPSLLLAIPLPMREANRAFPSLLTVYKLLKIQLILYSGVLDHP